MVPSKENKFRLLGTAEMIISLEICDVSFHKTWGFFHFYSEVALYLQTKGMLSGHNVERK